MMGAVWGLSSIIGPAVGGALTDGPGWRWCFLINVPVGVVVLIGLVLVFPNKRLIDHGAPGDAAVARRHVDWFGALTLVAFAVPLLLALSWGGREYAWGSPTIVGMLGGGGAMLVAFVFVELRAKEPIIPFRMFKDRVVWTSSLAATLVSVALFGAAMFIPLFLQAVVGASAIKSGAAMTPLMLSMITSSVLAGQLMTRTQRYKLLALFGVSTVTFALALFAWMDVNTSYGVTVRNMIVLGVGLGCTMPVFNLAVQNAVSPRDVGVATSSLQFLRSMGGSVGGAVFGALLTAQLAAHHVGMRPDQLVGLPLEARTALADGLHVVYVVAAAVMACGIVAGLLLEDRPLRKSNRMATPAATEA
jgi:MFS family permease